MKKIITSMCISISILFFIFINYSFAFGPSDNKLYDGIDVSQWQENINFKEVRNDGIEVVYIKATQGNDYIDPYFERNYISAKENNLRVGLYHFLTARNESEAIDEADFFSSVISDKQIDCRLAMDFEIFGRLTIQEINNISNVFLERVQERTKKEMLIYGDASNARDVFSSELAIKYPIWVAEYGSEEPFDNGKWNTWVGFQYTDTGRIRGINTLVDRDFYTKGIFLSDTSKIVKTEHRNNNEDRIQIIRVRRGNTLSQLAIKYKVTINEIVKLNDIKNRNLIYVGQILKIPYSTQDNKGETNHIIYTIKREDSLDKISRIYNISITEILRLNAIKNPNLIFAGETLRLEIKNQ